MNELKKIPTGSSLINFISLIIFTEAAFPLGDELLSLYLDELFILGRFQVGADKWKRNFPSKNSIN